MSSEFTPAASQHAVRGRRARHGRARSRRPATLIGWPRSFVSCLTMRSRTRRRAPHVEVSAERENGQVAARGSRSRHRHQAHGPPAHLRAVLHLRRRAGLRARTRDRARAGRAHGGQPRRRVRARAARRSRCELPDMNRASRSSSGRRRLLGARLAADSSSDARPAREQTGRRHPPAWRSSARSASRGPSTRSAIYRAEAAGVVTVLSVFGDGGGDGGLLGRGDQGTPRGLGTGFVVSRDGQIATNAHVVTDGEGASLRDAREVYVQFADGNQVPAKIVGVDPNADVGLLKVDPKGLRPARRCRSGRAPDVQVGEPGGGDRRRRSASRSRCRSASISATDRTITSLTGFDIAGALQTDAAINHGNSGGPLRQRARPGDRHQLADPVDRRRRRGRRLRGAGRHGQALARPAAQGRQGLLRASSASRPSPSIRSSAGSFGSRPTTARWSRRSCTTARRRRPGIGRRQRLDPLPGRALRDRRRRDRRRSTVTASASPRTTSAAIARCSPGRRSSVGYVRDGTERTLEVKLGEPPGRVGVSLDADAAARRWSPSSRCELRDHVLPQLGSHAGRAHVQARRRRRRHVRDRRGGRGATSSGWLTRARARGRLLLGGPRTGRAVRPRRRRCWSSIRSTARGRRWRASSRRACRSRRRPLGDDEPTMGDVEVGCVVEIKTGRAFVAERAGVGVAGRRAASAARPTRPTSTGCSGPTASAGARRGRRSRCWPS